MEQKMEHLDFIEGIPRVQVNGENIRYDLCPRHAGSYQRYIEYGIPPGSFMSSLLSNDLKETFARADSVNQHIVLDHINWLWNYAPTMCWGSRENFDNWLAHRQDIRQETQSARNQADLEEG